MEGEYKEVEGEYKEVEGWYKEVEGGYKEVEGVGEYEEGVGEYEEVVGFEGCKVVAVGVEVVGEVWVAWIPPPTFLSSESRGEASGGRGGNCAEEEWEEEEEKSEWEEPGARALLECSAAWECDDLNGWDEAGRRGSVGILNSADESELNRCSDGTW